MNEWAERKGKEHDRRTIDLMLAHVPTGKVERVYNGAPYMPPRREPTALDTISALVRQWVARIELGA